MKGYNPNQDPVQRLTESFGKLNSELSSVYAMFSHLKDSISQIDKLATRVTFQMVTMAGLHQPIPYGIRDLFGKASFHARPYRGRSGGSGPKGPGSPGGPFDLGPGPDNIVHPNDLFPVGPIDPVATKARVEARMKAKTEAAKSVLAPDPSHFKSMEEIENEKFSEFKAAQHGKIKEFQEYAKDLHSQLGLDETKTLGSTSTDVLIESLRKKHKSLYGFISNEMFASLNDQISLLAERLKLKVGQNLSGKKISSINTAFNKFDSFVKKVKDSVGPEPSFSKSDTQTFLSSKTSNSNIVRRAEQYKSFLAKKLGIPISQIGKFKSFNSDTPYEGWNLGTGPDSQMGIHQSVDKKDQMRVVAHEMFHNVAGNTDNKRERLSEKLWRWSERSRLRSLGVDNPTGLPGGFRNRTPDEARARQFAEIHGGNAPGLSSMFNSHSTSGIVWSNVGKVIANAFAFHLKGDGFRSFLGKQSLASSAWNRFKSIRTDEEGNPIFAPNSLAYMTGQQAVGRSLGVPFLAGTASMAGLLRSGSPDAMHTFMHSLSLASGKVGQSLIAPTTFGAKKIHQFGNWWDRRSETTKSAFGWGLAGSVGAMGITLALAKLTQAAVSASIALGNLRAMARRAGATGGLGFGKAALLGGVAGFGTHALINSQMTDSNNPSIIGRQLGTTSPATNEALSILEILGLSAGATWGTKKLSGRLAKSLAKPTSPWPTGMTLASAPTAQTASQAGMLSRLGSLGSGAAKFAKGGGGVAAIAAGPILDIVSDVYNMVRGKKSYMGDDILGIPTPTTGIKWMSNARESLNPGDSSGFLGRTRKEATRDIQSMFGTYDLIKSITGNIGSTILGKEKTQAAQQQLDERFNPSAYFRRKIGDLEESLGLSRSFDKKGTDPTIQKDKVKENKELQDKLDASIQASRVEPQFMGIEDMWKNMQLSVLNTPAEQKAIQVQMESLGKLLEEIAKNTGTTANQPVLKP